MSKRFNDVVDQITAIGLEHHRETILANSKANVPQIRQSIREVMPAAGPCMVVSAGPSLYRQHILRRLHGRFQGTIVATDGAYIQCLKAGIVPDYVVTIDPHPTRMVRWFGDPNFKENMNGDDYFARQDLDVEFRKNSEVENEANTRLVDQYRASLVIASTAPQNVVERTKDFNRYWFAPLVDDPQKEDSLTKDIVDATGLPALNTGGTVGTAGWVFSHEVLRAKSIAVVGMDFGYYMETPFAQTQSWNLLKDKPGIISDYYPHFTGYWGEFYTDPTYFWYRQNFLDLLKASGSKVVNCGEAGLLFGSNVDCMSLDEWLKSCS